MNIRIEKGIDSNTPRVVDLRFAIIGLGCVCSPLAIEFAKQLNEVGFDINQVRVDELKSGQDYTPEVTPEELKAATTDNLDALNHVYTVALGDNLAQRVPSVDCCESDANLSVIAI